jgi:hypothetical protein
VVVTRDQLNPAEQALWDAFPGNTSVDLTAGHVPDGGPDGSAPDSPHRTVRAEVIAALLRGANAAAAGQAAGIWLTGAHVTGVLDLTCATVTVPLLLDGCSFDAAPDLTDATVRSVKFRRCELPGFVARLLRAEGDVDFRDSVVRGRLSLVRATITGELRLSGAQLINPGGWALFAGGLVVESGFFGSYPSANEPPRPLTVRGGLRLAGARFNSGVFLDGAQLRNPDGVAISGDNLTVRGRMLCGNGFAAEGTVQLPHARIDGELSFAGASLSGQELALSLTNAVVDDLNLRTAGPVTGAVDLRHARCTVLRDDPASWPATVALDGLSYDAIDAGPTGLDVANRLRWLRRDRDGYRPQPYEQLAGLLRGLGADADARRVLLHKQRLRRRGLRPPSRFVGALLDWTVGYGYRPWRAALWLAVMLAAGTAVFSVWRPVPDGSDRPFDAVVYTLDLLVPISVFGLRDAYVPVGNTRWMAYLLTAAGWLLATALVAGITRALRRD